MVPLPSPGYLKVETFLAAAAVAAVAQEIGIGVISEEEHIPENYVHALEIADIGLRMKVHIICHGDRKGERLIRPFFDVAANLADRKLPRGQAI